MYPRSGFRSGGTSERTPVPVFRSGGTSERTLVPVFVPGEHPPKPPFWKPPFWVPPIRGRAHHTLLRRVLRRFSGGLWGRVLRRGLAMLCIQKGF